MSNNNLSINPKNESLRIQTFIKEILEKSKKKNVIIAVSGGVDSATVLHLLKHSIPLENMYAVTMPYFGDSKDADFVFDAINLPQEQRLNVSIKPVVDEIVRTLKIPKVDIIRRGNVMARVRMIILYDLSKKLDGLVAGTENKSEKLLGYFTRFGDEASDFEPIQHLYKTQVYELAKFLEVPKSVVEKAPSANLWQNQTDEGEFGFSYKEADQVLYLYFDKKYKTSEIEKLGFKNASKIIDFAKKNSYKHKVPYKL